MEKGIKEHRADVKYHRTSNALVNHIDEEGYLPNWKKSKILKKGRYKEVRKAIESIYITTHKNINERIGDIVFAPTTANILLKNVANLPGD